VSKLRIPRRRPSAALIVACCALFVALGGTSYALAVGSIGSREIRDSSIQSIDVHNHSLKGSDLAPDSVGGGAIKEQTLDAARLGTVQHAVTADRLVSGSVSDAPLGVKVAGTGRYSLDRGVTRVEHLTTGWYEIVFDRQVSGCLLSATPIADDYPQAPEEIDAGPAQTPETVRVHVANRVTGTFVDHGFYLLVFC
jgi:hypothetical protein